MKKILSVILVVTLVIAFPLTAMAGTSSTVQGVYRITANCGSSSSWYQVTGGSYPSGKGTFVYYNGQIKKTYSVAGVSYSGSWYGSKSASGGNVRTVSAKTVFKSWSVTAVP